MTPSYFFRHDYNARMDEKCGVLIARHGFEGYGLFWALVELMHEHSTGRLRLSLLEGTARMLGVELGTLQRVIDTCVEVGLFARDAEDVYSERVLEQRARVEDIRQKRSNAGRKGGQMKSTSQANAKQMPGKEEANSSREEERRENTKNYVGGRRDGVNDDVATTPEPVKTADVEAEPAPAEYEQRFKQAVVELGIDHHYADKTWSQGMGLPQRRNDPERLSDREEFVRKVILFLSWARIPSKAAKAKLLFHEIAGFVNDKGPMADKLSPQEKAARQTFSEETGQDLSAA